MRYRLTQIKLKPEAVAEAKAESSLETLLVGEVHRKLRVKKAVKIRNLQVIRESIDARKKPDVRLVYTVDFDCDEKLPLEEAEVPAYSLRDCLKERLDSEGTANKRVGNFFSTGHRPVIAGFGPCGIFAGLILAEAGLRPVIIERGESIQRRVAHVEKFWEEAGRIENSGKIVSPNPESNVQFGEGGAGTFSDGKLTTGIKDIRIRKVLQELVNAGADPEILYKQKPHIGTDKLREVVVSLRKRIEELGGEVRFNTKLIDIIIENGQLKKVVTSQGHIETDALILAIGHSACDTFQMLIEKGVSMSKKPFSIGVRIEHPQEMINLSQYGSSELASILGPAEYKLNYRCENGRGVYTFCMCPGGYVVNASTEPETSVTNGMSFSGRDSGIANSALLVDVRPEDMGDDPLAGFAFQKKYERLAWLNRTRGGMATSTYGDFVNSCEDPVRKSLPDFANQAILEAMPKLGKKLKGFDSPSGVITAVESRSSSPVRVARDSNMQAEGREGVITGLIPAGEGPGYAGGIMSAAVDGIKAAEAVIILKSEDGEV